jgi:collagenase-like PrtC family protease
VQTLSASVHAFAPAAADLLACGIRRLRLSPQTCDMVAVARIYRSLLDGDDEADAARARLSELDLPGMLVDGYARGRPGAEPVPQPNAG